MCFNEYKDIFEFWNDKQTLKNLNSGFTVHESDRYFLERAQDEYKESLTFKLSNRIPSPWDGKLKEAKVVLCYANSAFAEEDAKYIKNMQRQLTGLESFGTDK